MPEVLAFLEKRQLFVEHVSMRKDNHVVHIKLKNGIGVWIDASEKLYDTTRALYIIFNEVFRESFAQNQLVSVDVRNPLSLLYETR